MLQNTGNMKMNFQTRNPFNGEVIATYECDDLDGVNAKIGTVNDRFNAWRRVPPGERATLLQKALTYFDANRDVIAREITGQMGKPLRQAKNEVATFFERADYLLTTAEETLAPEVLAEKDGLCRRIEHVPLGTVMIFAAWNYPLLIAVNGVLAALLAGNSVVLKHARATLSIGEHFEKAFGRIEGHEGLLKHIVADHDTLAEVLQESNIHHVVFTGSVEGGQAVYQSTAKRAIECHLELGGKDGAFVDADTDPVKAAEVLVDGAMYNAGQSCCGIERVYAHEEIYDVFVETCRRPQEGRPRLVRRQKTPDRSRHVFRADIAYRRHAQHGRHAGGEFWPHHAGDESLRLRRSRCTHQRLPIWSHIRHIHSGRPDG